MSNKIMHHPCGTCGDTVLKHDLRTNTYIVPGKSMKLVEGNLVVWCRRCDKFVGVDVNPLGGLRTR